MSQSSPSARLLVDARSYLTGHFGGVDMSDLPLDSVKSCIDQLYTGGWVAYEADFRRFDATTTVTTEAFSPVKQKIIVEHHIGRRLKMHDEILSFECTDTRLAFALSFAKVDYRSRRDVITARRIELWVHERATADDTWGRAQVVEMDTATDEALVLFGAINTPDRAAAIAEQVETCYRPGTEKTPMAGWVARAELSWKQAHADETFPAHSTRTKTA